MKRKDRFPAEIECLCVMILNMIDMFLTIHLINEYEGIEMNPLMSQIIQQGQGYFVLFKFGVMLSIMVVTYQQWLKKRKVYLGVWGWRVVCAIYAIIVIWNTSMLLYAKSVI
tara:strand:- start:507 stop:842 length:336 start_codon:yes stop_codon:yes gene_type:complete